MIIIKVENNYQDIINYLWAKGYTWNNGQNIFDYTPDEVNFLICYNDKSVIYYCSAYHKNSISLEQFKKENPITLEDLKPGMVIEHSGGKRLVYEMRGEKFGIIDNAHCPLNDYRKDLTSDIFGCDINKVYIVNTSSDLKTMLRYAVLIWERSKEVELTMDEIAKKFGIDVSQLKIKK